MPYGNAVGSGLRTAEHLSLQRCPHCNTANPTIHRRTNFAVQPQKEAHQIPGNFFVQWHVYVCASCAGLVAAGVPVHPSMANAAQLLPVQWLVPEVVRISTDIPQSAAKYLAQARETLSSPAASVMMSAAAVDAMLKARNYKEGSLFSRIRKADTDGVLTAQMAEWADDIRLDANDERHADEQARDKTPEDANRCLEFADALADLLFVLPARVKRGRKLPETGAAPAPPGARPA